MSCNTVKTVLFLLDNWDKDAWMDDTDWKYGFNKH